LVSFLELVRARWHRPAVKFLLLPACACLLAACETLPVSSAPIQYTHFRVTNNRGELVADWIAEGPYRNAPPPGGYLVKAVERLSGPPLAQVSRFPNGWSTTVVGPHIIHWPCDKPVWLDRIDRASAPRY
jgi:hypothetical protein